MSLDDVLLFAPVAVRAYGQCVATRLGDDLAAHEERVFEDGEHKTRPLQSVRGRDVYVLQALHGDEDQGVNEKLLRLLFFLATLRDAHAEWVSAVIPYLAYAREDRRTKAWDPVLTRYLAQLFAAVGVDRVVALDVGGYKRAERLRATLSERSGRVVPGTAARRIQILTDETPALAVP